MKNQENMNVLIWVVVGFEQRDGQDPQSLNKDTFCRLPVTSAQCNIGTENYPDAGILPNYDDYEHSHGYGQIKRAFTSLTKDDILKPYISDHDFWIFKC